MRIKASSRITGSDLVSLRDPHPWMNDGACVGEPVDLWFPEEGQRRQAQAAKEICLNDCPVLNLCQEFAMAQGPMLYGIFGGLSKDERAALRRKTAQAVRATRKAS